MLKRGQRRPGNCRRLKKFTQSNLTKARSTTLKHFIRLHGFGEYAKWHLGIDDAHAENTKQRYKFPYGDFKNVHRCALLAAQSRAGQYQHYDIERAAIELREMIATENAGHQKP